MSLLQALAYGIIQGLTEFLPVSSSAHLVLLPFLTGWPDPGLAFDVALHAGTLLAVVIYFARDIGALFRGAFGFVKGGREAEHWLPWQIVAATLPGVVAGFLLDDLAETTLRSPWIIVVTLSVMGVLLWVADRGGRKDIPLGRLGGARAIMIGFAQALALIPGTSRSGVTITAGLLLGLERTAAVRFSFLLSIPITVGAVVLKSSYLVQNLGNPSVIVGILASAVSGLAAIHVLLTYVRNRSFLPFVFYRIALAAVLAAVLLSR